ncbi:MAG: hypothetical protein ER33_15270 [Cyanobium sp. CACIAM 14]|nr:MAG: hypothetical protein ER33_15270 [Cyanobium sp. CACIAM 14]
MPDYTASREEVSAGFSRLFAWGGACLLLVFLAFVLADSLPLQLLTPSWQLRFSNRLINTAPIALLGFVLLHLALYIEPSNGFLRARLVTARQGAIAVTFAFLLLVPLHSFATWRALAQAQGTQAMQRAVLDERVTMIRKAIEAAASPEDLQDRFSRLPGPRPQLPPAALALPLPELKRALLNELEKTQTRASERITRPTPADFWALGQGWARVTIASLGYAVAFAAGAQKPGASLTLLQSLGRGAASRKSRSTKASRRPS